MIKFWYGLSILKEIHSTIIRKMFCIVFFSQLHSLLRKHILEKKRTPLSTINEFFSHFIVILLLVAVYKISKVRHFGKARHDVIKITIPPTFINSSVPVINAIKSVSPSDFLSSMQTILNGPLPTPSFDTYVGTALYIRKNIYSSKIGYLDDKIYAGKYGNLLDIGTLHFAPYPSPLVDAYISHMSNSTKTFNLLKYYIHATESEAVSYIQGSSERVFALIVLRNITNQRINYLIRQNSSTVPNTNQITISGYSGGINTVYQEYYLSGFLTLQDSIDSWAFAYTGTINSNLSGLCSKMPSIFGVPYPTNAYKINDFYSKLSQLLGIALTCKLRYI